MSMDGAGMTRTRTRAAIAAATFLAASAVGGGTASAAADSHARSAFETWVTVPDVVGESEPDAVGELTLLGFNIHTTVEYSLTTCDRPVPPPDVAEQAPEGGNLVIRGANISLSLVSYMFVSSEC
jgi:beta-lactam-binding protein with PASTA domain